MFAEARLLRNRPKQLRKALGSGRQIGRKTARCIKCCWRHLLVRRFQRRQARKSIV
jgi:hypothetical protein